MSFTEDTEPRIIKFMDELEEWYTIEIGNEIVSFTFNVNSCDFDKHMLDGPLWKIHWAISRAGYPSVAGVNVKLTLHLAREHSQFEDQSAVSASRGVADED